MTPDDQHIDEEAIEQAAAYIYSVTEPHTGMPTWDELGERSRDHFRKIAFAATETLRTERDWWKAERGAAQEAIEVPQSQMSHNLCAQTTCDAGYNDAERQMIRAAALMEAAEAMDVCNKPGSLGWSDWLRDRAARIVGVEVER